MDGRAFLDAADDLAAGPGEAHWRAAAGRAYYALLHEGMAALDRWGFPIPPKEDLHRYVRNRLTFPADADLKKVGDTLEELGRLRNHADYRLAAPGPYASAKPATRAARDARAAVTLLDQIEADRARRAAAVAAIKAAFPP
ncbi:MAG: hypothetical protein L0Z62_41740 [Gemmataceae bacterium]|nr:hypothetical protein [Gemmataceae bacterium]